MSRGGLQTESCSPGYRQLQSCCPPLEFPSVSSDSGTCPSTRSTAVDTHTIHTDEFYSVLWIRNSCITSTGFMRETFRFFTQALLCDMVGKDDYAGIPLSSDGRILKPLPAIYLHVSRAVLHPVDHGHQQLVVHHPLVHLDETNVEVHVELERKRRRRRCFHSPFQTANESLCVKRPSSPFFF